MQLTPLSTSTTKTAKPFSGPLPSPTFIPSPPPHHASAARPAEFPTLGSLLPTAPSPASSPSRLTGPTAVFSPSLHSSEPPATSASTLSLSNAQPMRQRRKEPLSLPRATGGSWVNSDSDYVPLVPLALIVLVSAWVFWLCLPSHQQFLSSFSASPSHLTVFHHWQSPHNLPPLPHPSTLPSAHTYVGRRQQLSALHTAVSTHHSAVVVGPAGSGRTAFVQAYIDRYIVQSATAPAYNLILHLSASSTHALHADLTLLAASLQLPTLYPDARSLTATMQAFLASWSRYLVVFDGVRSAAARRELEAMLPRRRGKESEGLLGDTIFVMDGADSTQRSSQIVHLGGLNARQCISLLASVSGVAAVNETAVEAEQLCGRLDRLPQAVVLAGLYMRTQQVAAFADVTAALQAAREQSHSPMRAVLLLVLALPAFESSLPALLDFGLVTNHSSSVPVSLISDSFPLSLYVEYGLMWAPRRSAPYALLHDKLFRSTETKTASVLVLTQLCSLLQSPPSWFPSPSDKSLVESRVWQAAVTRGGLVDTLTVAALGQWMHAPLYSNFSLVLPPGAPSLSPVTLPALPSLSMSSWLQLPASSEAMARRVWGGHSAPRELAYTAAQAASLMPAVLDLLRPTAGLYHDVALHVTADDAQAISVTPQGASLSSSASPSVSPTLHTLLHLAAAYLADIHAERQLSSRYLTIAAALALQSSNHSCAVQSLLLLSVHHLLVDEHVNALSLLTYLHQRYIAPPHPSHTLSASQQANVLSALAFAYARAQDVDESERLLQEALTSRQRVDDRLSIVHLLSCRDLLLVRLWQSASAEAQLNAQYACQRIEHSVFSASSYAASARLLSMAVAQHATEASAAANYSLAAYAALGSVSASTPDHRLPLTLLYHSHHLFTSQQPHAAMPVLDHTFLSLQASFPRGLTLHTRPLLCVSVEVAAGLAVWQQGMEATRQGWEASRGVGDAVREEEWKRMFAWLYAQSEAEKAEERRREQARLEELKRLQAEEEARSRHQIDL